MDSLYNLAVMFSVLDQFTGPVQKMAQTLTNFEKTAQKAESMIDFGNKMAVSGAMVQGASASITNGLRNILTPTIQNKEALGALASAGVENLDAITQAAEKYTSVWAGTTEAQFIASAYDIKGGIASLSDEAVGQFTAMAAITAKATKATAQEMTSLFATGYGIYKDMYGNMTDMQFGEMFSGGIAAAVNQFKSTGSGMAQALTTLGAAATSAQRPFEEQLTVLGMLQATMPGGEAGTKYRAFIQSAAKAGTALGVSFVDGNNQMLGMADILDRLRGKYGDTLDAIEKQQIQKAFGSDEAVALIDLLYGKVGAFRTNMADLGEATKQGSAYAENMARTMDSVNQAGAGLQLVSQNFSILKRTIGEELSPLIIALVPLLQNSVNSFKTFAKEHPTITRTALLIATIGAVAFGVLAPILMIGSGLVMIGGYTLLAATHIRKGFLWAGKTTGDFIKSIIRLSNIAITRTVPAIGRLVVRLLWYAWAGGIRAYMATRTLMTALGRFALVAIRTAVTALPGLIAGVWSFTTALLANPITWVVMAVVGLGAALVWLWRNWDLVAAAFSQGWQRFRAAAVQTFVYLSQLLPQMVTQISLWIKAKGAEFMASGKGLILAFVQGIRSVIAVPAEVVKDGLAKLRRLLPFSDAKEGPLSSLTYSGAALMWTFAGGIQSQAGMLKSTMANTLSGMMDLASGQSFEMTPVLGGASGASSGVSLEKSIFGSTPRVNLREFIKETTTERQKETIRETNNGRPVVVLVNGGQVSSTEDAIDLAYRYLAMSGD